MYLNTRISYAEDCKRRFNADAKACGNVYCNNEARWLSQHIDGSHVRYTFVCNECAAKHIPPTDLEWDTDNYSFNYSNSI